MYSGVPPLVTLQTQSAQGDNATAAFSFLFVLAYFKYTVYTNNLFFTLVGMPFITAHVRILNPMAAEKQPNYFVGVDVGTGSARAGLFTESGALRYHSRKEIKTWVNEGFADGSYEQSTDDIWQAVCCCVKVGDRIVKWCFCAPVHVYTCSNSVQQYTWKIWNLLN